MKTFFKIFWKEIKPLVTIILALLLFIVVSGFGILANIYFSIKGCLQFKFWRGVKHFIVYWLNVLYQLWECVKYLINKVSVAIDLLGNVTSGELIEKVASRRKETFESLSKNLRFITFPFKFGRLSNSPHGIITAEAAAFPARKRAGKRVFYSKPMHAASDLIF